MTRPEDGNDQENSFDELDVSDATEQSSDDDLYDPADLNEEDWDEKDQGGADTESRRPRKKSSFFTLLIITCGVIAAAGVFYFQFLSVPPPAPVSPPVEEPQQVAVVPPDVPLVPAEPAPAPMPAELLTPMPSVTPEVSAEVPPSVPVPVDGEASSPPSLVVEATPAPLSEQAQESENNPAPVPVPDFSGAGPSPLPDLVSEAAAPSKGSEPSREISEAFDQRLRALEDKLNQLSDHVQTGNPAAAALEDLQSISSQIAEIAGRIDALEKALKERRIASYAPKKDSLVGEGTVKKQNTDTVPANSSKKREPRVPKASSEWQLRAVSQGSAYIAKPGKTDLMAVRVGDVIEGIGMIETIRQVPDGRWSVVATKGTIYQ